MNTVIAAPRRGSAALPRSEAAQFSAAQQPFGFNYAVNGFRGVCVMFVFIYHVAHSGLAPAPSSWPAELAVYMADTLRYGVELFFMISGYVIANSLQRHRTIRSFLWDRFSRIFPVWAPIHLGIVFVGAPLGLKMFQGADGGEQLQIFFANLILLAPLVRVPMTHSASWSLTYEWLFYFLAAAAIALIKFQRGPLPRLASWLLWSATVVSLLCLIPRALFFIPGVAVALYEPWLKKHAMRFLHWPGLSLLLFLVAWRWVGLDYAHPAAYPVSSVFSGMHAVYTAIALLTGLHVFACVCLSEETQHWLRGRVIQLMGNVSYSFYLWHPLMMFVTKRLTYAFMYQRYGWAASMAFFALSSFVLALSISYLSYRLLEMKLAKALRHLFDRRTERATRAPAAAGAVGAEGS